MRDERTGDGRAAPAGVRAGVRARLRVLQLIRATAVVLVLLCVVLAPEALAPHPHGLLVLTLGYAGVGGLAALAARRPGAVLMVLRAMLVVDAAYLTVGTHLTGGGHSPLHYALLMHLAAVTLLASARTGLALAGLDTALLVSLRVAVGSGLLEETAPRVASSPTQQLGVLLVVLWIVAGTTATLAVLHRRELRRRRHDLDALTLLTERVERAAQPAAVAQLLLDAVVSTYGLRRGVVLTVSDGGLQLLATSEQQRDVPRTGESPHVELAHTAQTTLLVRAPDVAQDPWLAALLPGAGPLIVVPLLAETRPLGALVVEGGGRAPAQRRLVGGLERSAAYGALALRNAALMESVQRLASTDGLTKIANRRAFEGTLERELSRATRAAEYVSLVLIDLDHFKALNDSLGHQAGDEVLRNAAAALACECREFDTAARYGGEEFAVILPGCGPDQAYDIAERLRLAVGRAPSRTTVTASAGVATFPAHAGDTDSLVRAADEALYSAKRGGRDRTAVSAGIAPEEQVNALIRRAVRERLRARDGRARDDDPLLPLPLFEREGRDATS
ncbi:MAG TPA: GGDEF domain-containing protein [Mycobacteriales bacterium]|nr:GGDEF domain-containing protein [Mycobacteriales bacterium]